MQTTSKKSINFAVAIFLALFIGSGCSSGHSIKEDEILIFNYPSTQFAGFLVNVPIDPVKPAVDGGFLNSFTVKPPAKLPSGLSLDSNSGAINGTPTAASAPADYFVNAHDQSGTPYEAKVNLAVYPPPGEAYSVDANLVDRTGDFYEPQNWPIDQSNFGICETASNSSMIGYAYYRNTNQVSPMFNLFHAYDEPDTFKGNKDNRPIQFYLWYTPDLGLLWDFFLDAGYPRFVGTPDPQGDAGFPSMYSEYMELHPDAGNWPLVAQTPDWATFKGRYDDLLDGGQVVITTVNMAAQTSSISDGGFAGNTLSDKIASALDQDNLVLIMFRVFSYYNNIYLTYSSPDLIMSPDAGSNNTWSMGRPREEGEDHWVYLFSYATATGGSNSRIFFVRNSWGSEKSQNGNYYMTDDFINASFYDLKTKAVLPNVQIAHAFKIQSQ